jgi:hypothetical protein
MLFDWVRINAIPDPFYAITEATVTVGRTEISANLPL